MFEGIDRERFLSLYEYFENLPKGDQKRKLNEEHLELQLALDSFDNGYGDINDCIKEFADVFHLLFQHIYAREIELQEVFDALLEKLDRTEFRKETKYYEKGIFEID